MRQGLRRRAALAAMGVPLAAAVPAGAAAQSGAPAASRALAEPLRTDVRLRSGRRLSYLAWGLPTAPALLLLPGRGSSGAEVQPLAAALAADHLVVALDPRGCGFSDWAPDGDYTVEAAVDDLQQFVAAQRWRDFVLYGHSYGAVVGIAYAAAQGALLRALVLEDGGPIALEDGSAPVLNPGQARLAGSPAPRPAEPIYESWADMLADPAALNGRPPEPLMLESRFVRHSDGRVRLRRDVIGLWQSQRGAGFTEPWPLVRALRTPTLLIRGERGLVPLAIAKAMQQANPRIAVATVEQAGHGVHRDNLGDVLRLTRTFLAGAHAAQPR